MQTELASWIRDTPEGIEADALLRKCVHCGFCNATCPTYQLLGDELDSPRGRIYLIKDMFENGRPATRDVVRHVDRCLRAEADARKHGMAALHFLQRRLERIDQHGALGGGRRAGDQREEEHLAHRHGLQVEDVRVRGEGEQGDRPQVAS